MSLLSVAGLALAGSLAATPAQATTPTVTTVSVAAGSTKVVTSTGKKLTLNVSAYKNNDPQGGHASASLFVELSKRDFTESHSWSFDIPTSALSAKGGKGTVTVTTKMAPYGKVKLHFKPLKPAKSYTCKGELQSKSQKVSLSGTFYFDTRSSGKHKWGHVGSKTKTFHFSNPSNVFTGYDSSQFCGGSSGTTPCLFTVSWSASKFHSDGTFESLGGSVPLGHSGGSIYGSRNVQLSKPSGASRYDSVNKSMKVTKLTVTSNGDATLALKGTGSATLKSTSPSVPQPGTCGKTKRNESFDNWYGTTYKNGSSPLSVTGDIFGAIKLANGSDSSITRTRAGTVSQ